MGPSESGRYRTLYWLRESVRVPSGEPSTAQKFAGEEGLEDSWS